MDDDVPWIRQSHGHRVGYHNDNLFLFLHEKILDFVVFVSPTERELARRHDLVREMCALVATLWSDTTLEMFGSHDTQLFLPNSDIDMVVFVPASGASPLRKLAAQLRKNRVASSVEVIDKARIPIVKFVHAASKLHVDVPLNVASRLETASLVKGYVRAFPFFRPLMLALKYFLAQRALNETYTGGVGSFLAQLMVVSFLQHRRRNFGANHDLPQHNNLGQLLLGFFTLYGSDFNYIDLGISVRNGGSYFLKRDRGWSDWNRPTLLLVENPNEPTVDVGKNSFNVATVRRAFDFARQVLTDEMRRRGKLPPQPGSILGVIIPPDSDLVEHTPPTAFGFPVLRIEHQKVPAEQL
ncbi:hypothetical protein PybrP1_003959 [[Pythium] brassicae (nom. inval.)]|nr:hypothetical protein PybrP1_003959 [[Pythium] brassicae (nom. inval.)]